MSLDETPETLPTGKEDVIEFLSPDKEPENILEPVKLKEPPVEEEIEVDEEIDEELELKEIEEELKEEEPDEEDLELMTPVPRREILKKYPQLFKDFPQLEKSYYRDKQFTEILPTIADAKEAVAKASVLDKFENDLMGGNTEEVLNTVKKFNEDSFKRIVDNYLPTLYKVDLQAYNHVVGNVIKTLVSGMVQEARSSGDDALQSAASLAYKFVFGNTNYTPPQTLAKPQEANPEADKLKAEREKFATERFQVTQNELSNKVQNTLKATIANNMDPKDTMTEYVRGKAVEDAMNTLKELISQDKTFISINNKLWQRAFSSNFAQSDVDKIRAAYLSKAKTLLPTVIKKARNEALKGTGKRISEDGPKKGPIATGKPSTSKSVKASDIPKGMKTLDFLMAD
jgi:hypothetical protein